MYMHVYIYVYIYIYIYHKLYVNTRMYMCICVCVYIYIYIYIHVVKYAAYHFVFQATPICLCHLYSVVDENVRRPAAPRAYNDKSAYY